MLGGERVEQEAEPKVHDLTFLLRCCLLQDCSRLEASCPAEEKRLSILEVGEMYVFGSGNRSRTLARPLFAMKSLMSGRCHCELMNVKVEGSDCVALLLHP